MEELKIYKTEYLKVYGSEIWHQLYSSLNFFMLDTFTPIEYSADVFETGLLTDTMWYYIR